MMFLIILITVISILLVFLNKKNYSFWKERGVPGPKPFPVLGNFAKSIIGKKSQGEIISELYRNYKNYPFVGVYNGFSPALIVRDRDFIKKITSQDFRHFQNNDITVDRDIDPILGRNPFVLKGEEWKKTRAQLTPCFTSGKMKSIFPILSAVAERMCLYVENTEETTLETKELCTKFTLDNVAACAFGTEGKCFENPKAEFRDLAKRFVSPSSWTSVKFFFVIMFPFLSNILKIKIVSKDVEDDLELLIRKTLEYREKNNIVRHDFLDSMWQLYKSNVFEEIDVISHAASFFADGFETSSQVMSFLIFNLASNPEVQSKLREEINATLEKNNDQLTYDSLQSMVYLDACLNESLRRNGPVYNLIKSCTEKYTYTPTDPDLKNITVTVQPGVTIFIPIEGLHNDTLIWDEPDVYRPERFLNKEDIPKQAFMPFNEGPRMCLGMRFGTLQIKTGIVYLVKNFEMNLNKKTKLPLTYDPWYMMPSPIGGLWVDFKKI